MREFQSHFATRLSEYVRLRRGLGFRFNVQMCELSLFDRFACEQHYEGPLTQSFALAFAGANPKVARAECARRYQVVRHFSEYLSTFEPETPRLDPKALVCSRPRPPAHIYTDEELTQLLGHARHLSPKNPVRGITLHAMVGLAASTGLRISEVVRLDREDVDLEAGVLVVRQTKFAKDRLVPVHSTTREVLRRYASVRDAAFPGNPCPAFFVNTQRRRFARNTLQQIFWKLTRRANLRADQGRGPSFHGLRHTFAVRRLIAWYREGLDVQAMLPLLATYMGHVHYTDTAYYLTGTPELLALAARRSDHEMTPESDCRRQP